jgi:hypothetical protein
VSRRSLLAAMSGSNIGGHETSLEAVFAIQIPGALSRGSEPKNLQTSTCAR